MCSECAGRARSRDRRRVALPRAFRFNHAVGVGLLYLPIQDKTVPYLDIVDHGSNLQVCARVEKPRAPCAWRAFVSA
eukprot:1325435-Pyramimonas_sp.AAC.1